MFIFRAQYIHTIICRYTTYYLWYLRYLWNLPHGIYPQNNAVSLSYVREMSECRCFFFPARLRFDQGWSKSWFRWCGDSSMLHPFLYLGPRKSRGVFVFCWMQGTRGAQLGQHSMVMVSTGTTLLDVLFCCLQIRWSEKFDEVEAFFQWYNNYHVGTWSFSTSVWVVAVFLSKTEPGGDFFPQSIHEMMNLLTNGQSCCCKFLLRHSAVWTRGTEHCSSWVVMFNVDFLKSYFKNFKESHVYVRL